MRITPIILLTALVAGVVSTASLFAWGSDIHSGIIHASLAAIPAADRIQERWGEEVWRLREYVQMGDWINTLVSQRERWETGGQTLEQPGFQFFANDYLLFPGASHSFQHMVPAVKATYRPYFLRALQALRTESPANSARWAGSLLHFVTDSGSPPHASGISGPDHTKMENWLDTSLIDLSQYHAKSLGSTDEAAADGLAARMEELIAFSDIRGKKMLPFVKVNDRAHMEPLAVEAAAESARTAADVIHTLLQLTAPETTRTGGSLIAQVSAPAMVGLAELPAKLVLLGTGYSTLSDPSLPAFHTYRGMFSLRNIPVGAYRAAIERVGSETLYVQVAMKAGETSRANWDLQPTRVAENLVPNPDLTLHWLTPDAPDHWRLDSPRHRWVSDNIPVTPGRTYRAKCEPGSQPADGVELQWMAHAWEAMNIPATPFDAGKPGGSEITAIAPAGSLFVRFIVEGQREPSVVLRGVSITADHQ